MSLVIAMGIFFIACTVIFVAIAIFLPEWMGITGKKQKDHRGTTRTTLSHE